MSMMDDPDHPPPEEGVVELLVNPREARSVVVRVSFLPKSPDLDPLPTWRRAFPSAAAAHEFIAQVHQPLEAMTGSPKQARAKKAALLRVHTGALLNYEIETKIEEIRHEPPPAADRRAVRATGRATPAGVRAPDREPVSHRPAGLDLLGLVSPGSTLSEQEAPFPEDGGEAEVGGEESGSET